MGGLTGVFSGDNGSDFEAQGYNLDTGFTPEQIANSYSLANSGLGQQQAFLNALNGANGVGNLSSVFNQQQGLADQLQQNALGLGPNPAQAMLNQATGQNVAQQAALMGSQRGVNQNAGLLARQASNVGAGLQQQAAGQGAVLQAQQQLGAQAQLGQQQQAMANLANSQVAHQQQGLNAYNQGAQSEQQILQNSLANKNNAGVSSQSNINTSNAGVAAVNAGTQGQIAGGLISGASSAIIPKAHGGMISAPKRFYAAGGSVGPQSVFGQYLSGWAGGGGAEPQVNIPVSPSNAPNNHESAFQSGQGIGQAIGAGINYLATDHSTPQTDANLKMPSFGGAKGVSMSGQNIAGYAPRLAKFEQGGQIPGRGEVKGDSYANDDVPIMASPGEIVIPRSITMGPNPIENAAAFVRAVLSHGRGKHEA